jgi:hypothetical protein
VDASFARMERQSGPDGVDLALPDLVSGHLQLTGPIAGTSRALRR